jgi:uncharacterized phage protein (TIGR02218 family)
MELDFGAEGREELMSYDDREKSRFGAQPIEAFRFAQGENLWLYTSADREIVLPAGTFTPETITRTELDFSKEDVAETMEFEVPVANPVASLFIGDLPSSPVWIRCYRAHRGDESEAVTFFIGKITRTRFAGSQAVLVGTSLSALLSRSVPVLKMQTPCNHVLFSSACGVDPSSSRDSVTIATVDGATVTSSDFALRSDGWFEGGRLVSPDNESRFIVKHVGSTVTLISPLPGLESLDVCWAYWGCDHLETTCSSKFSNVESYLGWSDLPNRNPFEGRID